MKRINKEKMEALRAKGALLADMRSPVSYRDGHVDGAVNLPLRNFTNAIMQIADKNKSIVMYADSVDDLDLTQGVKYAELLGFSNIYVADFRTLTADPLVFKKPPVAPKHNKRKSG